MNATTLKLLLEENEGEQIQTMLVFKVRNAYLPAGPFWDQIEKRLALVKYDLVCI